MGLFLFIPPLSLYLLTNTAQKTTNGLSIDGVLGIRTWDHRMEGADESTELGQHPQATTLITNKICCFLKAAAVREEELQTRLNDLRLQVNDKRMSMQDHMTHLEMLKDEVRVTLYRD